jgi:3-(methylthio)propanoyl-CoA dehydrogenase
VRARAQERAEILTPITKGWGTDLGVELTSIAVQVHGGMGYVEETGVAQHYRDARIAPIYEGTNGIQAMDLVGRKLGLRGGQAMADLVGEIAATADEATAAGGALAEIGGSLAEGVAAMRDAATWLATNAPSDPNNLFAGATPFLRLAGIVAGGWVLTRKALAASALQAGDGDGFSSEFLEQKVVSARFFAAQVLPQAGGLLAAVVAGPADLFAATF